MASVTRPGSNGTNGSSSTQGPVEPKVPVTKTIEVKNSEELKAALASAEPGTKIKLADGTYNGPFKLEGKTGVTIEGSKNAILDGGSTDGKDYALHLENSNQITLTGFTVKGGQKGIVLDESNDNLLDNLTVTEVGMEAIHFRKNSSNNILQNSHISHTGKANAGYGEGVYIGSDSERGVDQSNFNQIINNTFGEGITAENIDIKENTKGGIIKFNIFNGSGLTGAHFADSTIDVKPGVTGYEISNNIFTGVNSGSMITFKQGGQGSNLLAENDIR